MASDIVTINVRTDATHAASGLKVYNRPKTDYADYNKWRRSLPNHCWRCPHFDECRPDNQCMYNPRFKDL